MALPPLRSGSLWVAHAHGLQRTAGSVSSNLAVFFTMTVTGADLAMFPEASLVTAVRTWGPSATVLESQDVA